MTIATTNSCDEGKFGETSQVCIGRLQDRHGDWLLKGDLCLESRQRMGLNAKRRTEEAKERCGERRYRQ